MTPALLGLLLLVIPLSARGQESFGNCVIPDISQHCPVNWPHVALGFGSATLMSVALERATGNEALSIVAPVAVVAIVGGIFETRDCDGTCSHMGDFTAYMAGAIPGAILGHFLSDWLWKPDGVDGS